MGHRFALNFKNLRRRCVQNRAVISFRTPDLPQGITIFEQETWFRRDVLNRLERIHFAWSTVDGTKSEERAASTGQCKLSVINVLLKRQALLPKSKAHSSRFVGMQFKKGCEYRPFVAQAGLALQLRFAWVDFALRNPCERFGLPSGLDPPTMPVSLLAKSAFAKLVFAVTLWITFSKQHVLADQISTRRCNAEVCCCSTTYQTGGWDVLESANFRVFHMGQVNQIKQLLTDCEQQRWALQKRWLHAARQTAWTPKCDVYCYPTGRDYARLTKYPAESWGHVDLEIGDGRVWRRRLNLRADLASRLTLVAAHELTHVVLADAFSTRQIPRWADEGIAVQSEPNGRRHELRQKLNDSLAQGRRFSLTELTSAASYPADPVLVDLFYAQSGAWVEFLTVKKKVSGAQLLKIVSRISETGLHSAVRENFQGLSIAELEAEWREWMNQPELLAENK